MDTNEELGKYLRACRERAGLTQKEVSQKMGYATAQFVSNWEHGVTPPIRQLRKISKIYNISADELFEYVLHGDLKRLEKRLRDQYAGKE